MQIKMLETIQFGVFMQIKSFTNFNKTISRNIRLYSLIKKGFMNLYSHPMFLYSFLCVMGCSVIVKNVYILSTYLVRVWNDIHILFEITVTYRKSTARTMYIKINKLLKLVK